MPDWRAQAARTGRTVGEEIGVARAIECLDEFALYLPLPQRRFMTEIVDQARRGAYTRALQALTHPATFRNARELACPQAKEA